METKEQTDYSHPAITQSVEKGLSFLKEMNGNGDIVFVYSKYDFFAPTGITRTAKKLNHAMFGNPDTKLTSSMMKDAVVALLQHPNHTDQFQEITDAKEIRNFFCERNIPMDGPTITKIHVLGSASPT